MCHRARVPDRRRRRSDVRLADAGRAAGTPDWRKPEPRARRRRQAGSACRTGRPAPRRADVPAAPARLPGTANSACDSGNGMGSNRQGAGGEPGSSPATPSSSITRSSRLARSARTPWPRPTRTPSRLRHCGRNPLCRRPFRHVPSRKADQSTGSAQVQRSRMLARQRQPGLRHRPRRVAEREEACPAPRLRLIRIDRKPSRSAGRRDATRGGSVRQDCGRTSGHRHRIPAAPAPGMVGCSALTGGCHALKRTPPTYSPARSVGVSGTALPLHAST